MRLGFGWGIVVGAGGMWLYQRYAKSKMVH